MTGDVTLDQASPGPDLAEDGTAMCPKDEEGRSLRVQKKGVNKRRFDIPRYSPFCWIESDYVIDDVTDVA